jgi:seryl-tRNA synthetase
MTSEDVIHELAEALRDTINEIDELYVRANPESAYLDLACKLIFRMKTVTIVPVHAQVESREAEIRQAEGEGAVRIFEALDRWLLAREAGARSIETGVNVAGRREITMTEGANTNYEVKGFFQGESLQDACAQAAQVLLFNGDDS